MVEGHYEYIEMNLLQMDVKKKTETYAVRNIRSQEVIGYIKWEGAWRQYCFYPEGQTIWSRSCLMDVQDFLCKLAYERTGKGK